MDNLHASSLIQPSRVPTLFRLAAESCARHIQQFGTLEGLPWEPFGQAILEAFIDVQHDLNTMQRQVGILVFAESYGHNHQYKHHHPTFTQTHPTFSGLSRLSTVDELSLLPSFSDCLVYLDLSYSSSYSIPSLFSSSSSVSLSNNDLVALAGMKQLRVLNLTGQAHVGDVGLSHLIISTEFKVGLERLEYLGLRDTGLTDQGLGRLWRPSSKSRKQQLGRQQREQRQQSGLQGQTHDEDKEKENPQCVWRHLLGIDVSGTDVHPEVAMSLFSKVAGDGQAKLLEASWRRLPPNTILFPELTNGRPKASGTTTTKGRRTATTTSSTTKNSLNLCDASSAPQSKMYIEADGANGGWTVANSLSIQKWADALSAIEEKYAWVRIGTSHGEHRVSVADGLPALLALLKMSSVHVQELPDDLPLPLYPTTYNSGGSSPFSRQRRRQAGEHSIGGRGEEYSAVSPARQRQDTTTKLGGGRQVSSDQVNSLTKSHGKRIRERQSNVALIFVRDRARVEQALAETEEADQAENADWSCSQATLVNPLSQPFEASSPWHGQSLSAQSVAKIRRPHHSASSAPNQRHALSVQIFLESDCNVEKTLPIAVATTPSPSQKRKRVWMPKMARSTAIKKRNTNTPSSIIASTPFIEIVKDKKKNRGNDLFAALSVKDDEGPFLSPFSLLEKGEGGWRQQQKPPPQSVEAIKRPMPSSVNKQKNIKTASGRELCGSSGGNNLLTAWVKMESPYPASVTPLESKSKQSTKREEFPAKTSPTSSSKTQDFHFVDEKRKRSSVSLTSWLEGGRTCTSQARHIQVETPPSTTLWMKRMHEEGMALSHTLSMSKKDVRASIRQVLPDGVKVPIRIDALEEEHSH